MRSLEATTFPSILSDPIPAPFQPPVRLISPPWCALFGSLFVVLTCVGLLGNLVVVVAISGERKMRKSVMNMLLLNLAVADALNLITTTVEWTPTVVVGYPGWMFPALLCPIARYLECVFLFTSILTQLTVCVERYIAIVYPIHARRLCSRRNILLTIAGIWLLVGTLALPYLLFNRKRPHSRVCSNPYAGGRFWLAYKWVEFLCFYLLPCFAFVTLYSRVCIVLWVKNTQLYGSSGLAPPPMLRTPSHPPVKNGLSSPACCPPREVGTKSPVQPKNSIGSRLVRSLTPSNQQRESSRLDALRTRRSVVKMLVACVSVYFICYSPIQGIFLSRGLFNINFHPPYEFILLMNALAITCSAVNPLLYTMFSKRFRARIAKLLVCSGENVAAYEGPASGGLFGRTTMVPGGDPNSCNSIKSPRLTPPSKANISNLSAEASPKYSLLQQPAVPMKRESAVVVEEHDVEIGRQSNGIPLLIIGNGKVDH